jgi:hypothetical protein
MNICNHCGVELEDKISLCPLCGKNPSETVPDLTGQGTYPSDIINLQKKENRKHIWELSGIIAFSGITVCTIVDLVLVDGLKWSLYADASILAAWSIFSLILLSFKKPHILIPGIILTILAMLIMFDLISFKTNWFIPIGLPLTISAGLFIYLIIILNKSAHLKGFNIIAVTFIIIGCYCMIIEIVTDKYLTGIIYLGWSLITAVSILPIALVLFFIHYRLKKGNKLDSFFHV